MKKIPGNDPRAQHRSSNVVIDRNELVRHLRGKHHWVLATMRADGRPQMSLVTGGMLTDGTLAIASYPSRVKTTNIRRDPRVSVVVMGEVFNSPWVQIDGTAGVIDMPEAGDAFVEYYRAISGEHPDWDDYRQAMTDQGKAIIVIEPTGWSPLSKGGFPPELFEDEQ